VIRFALRRNLYDPPTIRHPDIRMVQLMGLRREISSFSVQPAAKWMDMKFFGTVLPCNFYDPSTIRHPDIRMM